MSNFYTNVMVNGDQIFVRGIENGKKFIRKEEFFPTMYLKTKKDSEWKTLYDEPVEELKPGSIRDTRDFLKRYQEVEGFSVYGNNNYVQQYISDNYTGTVKHDVDKIKMVSIDIETSTEFGFPDIKTANEEVLLITVVDVKTHKCICFGSRPSVFQDTDTAKYILCNNEEALLKNFLMYWQSNYPDIITGWNTEQFDIVYIVNRIKRLLGDSMAKKLSPWNMLFEKKVKIRGKEEQIYDICGIASLDYLDLYKKYTYNKHESYSLDFICNYELGEKKLENPGESFKDFYTNHWDTFISYNIRDAVLVVKLNDKMRLLELVMTIAYQAKINYEDVYSPVKTWEAIIYNYLRERKIAIPQTKFGGKSEQFEGAYVKEPLVGFHKWIASFDLNSLYPHLIMQYNMSPETITDIKVPCSVDEFLDKKIDTSIIEPYNVALTANGWCYTKDKKGFLPQLMENMYADRSKAKKQMLKLEQEFEHVKQEIKKRSLES
jgi:DNA polymerase elongation subunit (family B)